MGEHSHKPKEPSVSHGRGGAGNINPDSTPYVDGEVTRTGVEGTHGDGAYSTGRGGAANIGDARTSSTCRLDKEIVPEVAVRPSAEGRDFHVGRGGAGNEHVVSDAGDDAADEDGKKKHKHKHKHAPSSSSEGHPVGLADLLKAKLFGKK